MKKLSVLLIILFLFITIPVKADEVDIESNNAVLYNLNDNTIVYEKNKDKKVSIASLTKLMTALVAIEKIDDLNQKIRLEKSDYDKLLKQDASRSSLKKDKEYTYMDLLYGLILESGADCANALARLTYENENDFVKAMNKKAKEIGMNNTSFANPIGLDDKNNYSTMEDVSILLREDLKNDTLRQIITTLNYKLTDGTEINHTIYDYMKHFKIDMPYMEGGKTGYELESGYALASIANKNGTTLMLITSKVDKIPGHVKDAKKIYDYYFNNYSYSPVIKEGETLVTLNAKYLSKNKIEIKSDEDILYYLKNDYDKSDIKTEYKGIRTITLNNKYNQKLGKLNIYYKDKLIKTYPVVLNQRIFPNPFIILGAIITYALIILSTFVIIGKIKRSRTMV